MVFIASFMFCLCFFGVCSMVLIMASVLFGVFWCFLVFFEVVVQWFWSWFFVSVDPPITHYSLF